MIATNFIDFSFSSSFCHRGVISLTPTKSRNVATLVGRRGQVSAARADVSTARRVAAAAPSFRSAAMTSPRIHPRVASQQKHAAISSLRFQFAEVGFSTLCSTFRYPAERKARPITYPVARSFEKRVMCGLPNNHRR